MIWVQVLVALAVGLVAYLNGYFAGRHSGYVRGRAEGWRQAADTANTILKAVAEIRKPTE